MKRTIFALLIVLLATSAFAMTNSYDLNKLISVKRAPINYASGLAVAQKPCQQCLAKTPGNPPDCNAACKRIGLAFGSCPNPASSDPSRCCACSTSPPSVPKLALPSTINAGVKIPQMQKSTMFSSNPPCSKCLPPGATDCNDACRKRGMESGTCGEPQSNDVRHCCVCKPKKNPTVAQSSIGTAAPVGLCAQQGKCRLYNSAGSDCGKGSDRVMANGNPAGCMDSYSAATAGIGYCGRMGLAQNSRSCSPFSNDSRERLACICK